MPTRPREPDPTLEIILGKNRGEQYALTDDTIRIGRSEEADIVVEDPSRKVSSVHAILRREDDGYTVEDNSRNGTWVRTLPKGKRVRLKGAPYQLAHGETVILAKGLELRLFDPAHPPVEGRGGEGNGGGNKLPLVLGLAMWVGLAALFMVKDGGSGTDAAGDGASVQDLISAFSGGASSPEIVGILAAIEADETGWVRESLLQAAWNERRAQFGSARDLWARIYYWADSRDDPGHVALASLARGRMNALREED